MRFWQLVLIGSAIGQMLNALYRLEIGEYAHGIGHAALAVACALTAVALRMLAPRPATPRGPA